MQESYHNTLLVSFIFPLLHRHLPIIYMPLSATYFLVLLFFLTTYYSPKLSLSEANKTELSIFVFKLRHETFYIKYKDIS